MEYLFFYLGFMLFLVVISFIGIRILVNFLHDKNIHQRIMTFETYMVVLEYHLQKAYKTIHKDNILIYSISAVYHSEKEIDELAKKFVKLSYDLIGPNLIKEFIILYGDESTFLKIVLDYFIESYENDEIRKTAINNLTKDENKKETNIGEI